MRIYGTVFTNNLIAPVMEKLTGAAFVANSPERSAHGLNRIIIADGVESGN